MTGAHRPVSNREREISEPSDPGTVEAPGAAAPAGGAGVAQPFDVHGEDDRVVVDDVRLYPWRAVCHLQVTRKDGGQTQGTGWFVGPRTVITAGHIVCPDGVFAARVDVTPGRGEHDRAHETIAATAFETTQGWAQYQSPEHDYGGIFLDPSDLAGSLGYFGFATRSTAELDGAVAEISGYSRDRGEVLIRAAGLLQAPEARRLIYQIDTEDGESGAPIYVTGGGDVRVIGIHTDGFPDRNEGLRITIPVAENLRRWKSL